MDNYNIPKDIINNRDRWSQSQRFFKTKASTILGYIPYACYRDASEDPEVGSKIGKFFNRFDIELLEIELFKGTMYTAIAYGLYELLF